MSCERTNYALLCVDSYYSVISYYVHAVVGCLLVLFFRRCRLDVGEWVELDYNLCPVKTEHISE